MGGSWQAPERSGGTDESNVREHRKARALALWRGSEPALGTLAERYLTGRGLASLATSSALRFRGDCRHPEGGSLPTMVALVTDVTGTPLAIHRTYLVRDGSGKASIKPAKASLGPVWSCAIRLDPLADELVIGEGIESSASAGRLLGLPAWAAISTGNLAQALVLPREVRATVVASDSDPAGRRAAQTAAGRWLAEGRCVRIAMPDRNGSDFADLLGEAARG